MEKNKKPSWYTIFIIAVSAVVLIIASVVIYSSFFESDINKEKNRKIAEDYMTEKLQENKLGSAKVKEDNNAIIAKHGLSIAGTYTCVYNEPASESENSESGALKTNQVIRTVELMDDSTAMFADGTRAWWSLTESSDGTVHMGLVLPEKETPELYLICDNALIDEGSAIFVGEVPESKYFDGKFEANGLVLEFSADGSVDGEFTQMIKEDDIEYPYKEAYAGKYERNGDYLDIGLNGSFARYYIFKNTKTNAGLSGFAARYYIKNN